MIIAALSLIGVFALVVVAYMQHPKFGRAPSGARLEIIQKSPHYKNGAFENILPTPATRLGANSLKMLWKAFFGDKGKRSPSGTIPSVKRDLRALDINRDIVVWFGHSSYFIQVGGKRILVDPIFSGSASPVPFTAGAYKGSDAYAAEDMPDIDYLFITHDHWDHLDYETIRKLKTKVAKIICPIGVGEHLEYWGIEPERITEMQWDETASPETGMRVHCVTARHFSGRTFSTRNHSLWASFILELPTLKIYIGGDSGYGPHFEEIGKRFGGVDLAILENGQYDANWPDSHMIPENTLRAAVELKAKRLLPVHNSKFSMAQHDWNDPHKRISQTKNEPDYKGMRILTPIIGEITVIRDDTQTYAPWWESVR